MDSEQIEQFGSVWNGLPAEFDEDENGPMAREVDFPTFCRKLAIRVDRLRACVPDDP